MIGAGKKMTVWELPVLCALSVLGGVKSTCGLRLLSGKEISFLWVWKETRMYVLAVIWMVFYGLLWFGSGRSAMLIRTVDLLCTYGILAAVDGKCRIVPDTILLFFFAGQMLLGALSMEPAALLQIILAGIIFALAVFILAWFSKGKMGMGDAKLLGVTAMTAGWGFALQTLILGFILSFVYSIWLIIVCKKSIRTEFPFVPFLAAGAAMGIGSVLL